MCDELGKAFRRALLLVLSFGLAGAVHGADDGVFSFGVVPQFEQRKLFAIWKPIVDEISKLAGVQLRLVATLSVPEFEHELGAGSFDFCYANPYHILREAKRQGYLPLVRDAVPLEGILVVPKSSPVRSVAELDGKSLAIPSPNAIGASLLLRSDLENIHRVRMTPLNAKTHSSVYLNVATGLADAGGGVQKTLEEQPPPVRDALRILYTTRSIPSHPVSAHPRIPKAVREAVRKAFLDLAATPAGHALLAEVPMSRAIEASMADYAPMLDWKLEKYWVEEGKSLK